jgi:hypothetical protein
MIFDSYGDIFENACRLFDVAPERGIDGEGYRIQ